MNSDQHSTDTFIPSSEAIAPFELMSKQEPQSAEAFKNLGNTWLKQGHFANAIACYQKALDLDPHYAIAYYNLGLVYQRQNYLETAINHYRKAIQLEPENTAALNNLGLALQDNGQPEEAIACYQDLLAIDPSNATAYYNLGFVFQGKKDLKAANSYYQKALELNPNDVESLNNLGFVLNELGQPLEAMTILQKALEFNPNYVEAHVNLGISFGKLDRFTEAIVCYQKALTLDSAHVEAHVNLGFTYAKIDRFTEAIARYQKALELNPQNAAAYNNLGIALEEQGDFEQALSSCERAIQIEPQHAHYRLNRSLLLLRLGRWKLGFAEQEARWQVPEITPQSFTQPLWDGANFQGRRILLHSEGGFGDILQFVRYVPLVAEQGGAVTLVCPQALMRLLSQLPKVDQLLSWDSNLPDFDVHAPLMSLPYLFGTTLETIPAQVPYLYPPDTLPFTLTAPPNTHLKVGITWGGNPNYGRDRSRSCSLQQFLPFLEIPQVAFYSLQKGPRAIELEEFPQELPLQNLSEQIQDFSDTAAAMAQLDLIITTDTSVAHLAGALGRPVWVLLNFVPDWRWMLEREDSPWYPTMRLFRQPQLGDWVSVFDRVALALQNLVRQQ